MLALSTSRRRCARLQVRPEHWETVLRDLLLFVECRHTGAAIWLGDGRKLRKVAKLWVSDFRGVSLFWGEWRDGWCLRKK
jgi:hypothetical protein